MPDLPTVLSFGHHLIPLLPQSGEAAAPGGKVHLPAVKAACKSAERIHGVLMLAGRYELAVVPDTPDFFDPHLVNSKARNLAWDIIRETPRLQWLVPTRRPDLITSSLPPVWNSKRFPNVCIGYMADTDAGFTGNLNALRDAPLHRRMLLLTPASPPFDETEHFKGIDWVVFAGTTEHAALAATIEASCRQAGAVFLFHHTDGSLRNAADLGACGHKTAWPSHPFGDKIHLARPTLPKLTAAPDTAMLLEPPIGESTASGAHEVVPSGTFIGADHANEPPAQVLALEAATLETRPATPEAATTLVDTTGHHDFARLDEIVRRGLATFLDVGNALAEIRDRELWRAGGHPSWAAYCRAVSGLSKSHANRIITSAQITSHIAGVAPIGVTPGNESQVRPLARLKQADQQVLAWTRAVERSDGQPTAKMVSEIVAELMAEDDSGPRADSKNRIRQTFENLRDAVRRLNPPAEVVRLMVDLQKLLNLRPEDAPMK